jgi:hypothetical protein
MRLFDSSRITIIMPITTQFKCSAASPVRPYGIRTVTAFVLALLPGFASGIPPFDYELKAVAKTGDIINGKMLTGFKLPSLGPNAPAINSAGRVAFYATYLEGGGVGEAIFTPASVIIKTGDVVSGRRLDGIGFAPALNDDGMLAVRGFLDSKASAIFTSDKLLAGTGKTIGGQTLTEVGSPSINNNGTTAFAGAFSGGSGIFTQRALLAKSGQAIGGMKMDIFGPPAINNRGTVAFQAWSSGRRTTAILTPTTVLVRTGNTIDGKTLTDLLFSPSLNSSDTVAFVGAFQGGMGIFTQKALLVQSGDTVGGLKLTGFGLPAIDDSGTVAFLAAYGGGIGIFTQSALLAKTGDTVLGKSLTRLGPPAINRGGEVAFAAWFSDGSSAIVLARPRLFQSSRGISGCDLNSSAP